MALPSNLSCRRPTFTYRFAVISIFSSLHLPFFRGVHRFKQLCFPFRICYVSFFRCLRHFTDVVHISSPSGLSCRSLVCRFTLTLYRFTQSNVSLHRHIYRFAQSYTSFHTVACITQPSYKLFHSDIHLCAVLCTVSRLCVSLRSRIDLAYLFAAVMCRFDWRFFLARKTWARTRDFRRWSDKSGLLPRKRYTYTFATR